MSEWLKTWEQRVETIEDLVLVEDFFFSLWIVEGFKFDTTIPLVEQHMKRIGYIMEHFSEPIDTE